MQITTNNNTYHYNRVTTDFLGPLIEKDILLTANSNLIDNNTVLTFNKIQQIH